MDSVAVSQDNLYESGMSIIISSSVLYSAPFLAVGRQIIDQFEILKGKDPEDLTIDLVKNIPLEQFLADFYKYSNAFVERVTQYFSDIIRKNTQRNDIKEKTTERISDEIRMESFKKFEEVFAKYTATMGELGVQLESVSSIKSAIQGTFVGGGLQLMGSKGKSSGAGMVAGALIGAAMAEAEKKQLREKLLKAAFDGIKETIEVLPICNQKLMDQYSSYIFGSNIDFNERDKQIERGKILLNDIKIHCSKILDDIIIGNSFWTESIIKINKAIEGKSFKDLYGMGCAVYIVFFIVIISVVSYDSVSDSLKTIITFGGFVLPFLYATYYRLRINEKYVNKEKTKVLSAIKLNEKKFIQLRNSIKSLEEIKINFSFS